MTDPIVWAVIVVILAFVVKGLWEQHKRERAWRMSNEWEPKPDDLKRGWNVMDEVDRVLREGKR